MVKPIKKHLHLRSGDQLDTGRPGAGHSPGEGAGRGNKPVVGKAKGMVAGTFLSVQAPRPFRHAVFASEAEYERSVASVVARIQSGQVKARPPDE